MLPNSEPIKVLDHGYVKYVEHWGSDERIIESARMSTNKGFQGWGTEENPGDEKLLKYLYINGHHSPFEQAGLVVEAQAPIFVFREWHRHRTQSYNELSARYTELPEVYYIPDLDRMRAGRQSTKNKQSSAEDNQFDAKTAWDLMVKMRDETVNSIVTYRELLSQGVARELARLVLPVNMYSRMRASANLRNWLHFLELRTSPQAQWEIRQYANVVGDLVKELFPRTYELFKAH